MYVSKCTEVQINLGTHARTHTQLWLSPPRPDITLPSLNEIIFYIFILSHILIV